MIQQINQNCDKNLIAQNTRVLGIIQTNRGMDNCPRSIIHFVDTENKAYEISIKDNEVLLKVVGIRGPKPHKFYVKLYFKMNKKQFKYKFKSMPREEYTQTPILKRIVKFKQKNINDFVKQCHLKF